jgi:hypothetical protein
MLKQFNIMSPGFIKPAHAFWVALACLILLFVLTLLPESADAATGRVGATSSSR